MAGGNLKGAGKTEPEGRGILTKDTRAQGNRPKNRLMFGRERLGAEIHDRDKELAEMWQ